MMKKNIVFIIMLLISQPVFSQETAKYTDVSTGFSFEYPSSVNLYTEWDPAIKSPENFYIFIEIDKLPLKIQKNFGFKNIYIDNIREGLEQGEMAWTPFYYKHLTDIVGLSDCNAFESYTLSWYGTDSIEFESRIIFFKDDNIVSIWLSANAFKNEIIEAYPEFFVDVHGYWEWEDKKSETFLLEMKDLIKNRDYSVFEEWMDIAEIIKNSMVIK